MAKSRVGLWALWALVPVVVSVTTVGITAFRWPAMASGFSADTAYWFIRSAPLPDLLFGPLSGLVTVFALPLHRRRPIAMMNLLCFMVVAGFYVLREITRLSPAVTSGALSWDDALSYLDVFAVIGGIAGFAIMAISARISVVVPQSVKRARRGALTEQTFSGVYSTASKDTQWLSLDNYAALVCGSAFRSSDLVTGDRDVFLNIPAAILRSYPGIGRVIIGSLINAMTQADGAFKRRALFMLDEVDLLGYMRVLEEARDRGRKYGVTLMLMYQSVGQLERHFGKDGATSWIDGCAFASYAAIKALDTARSVSAQCGEMTVEVKGRSRNIGWNSSNSGARNSENLNVQRRPLIMPHEITQSMRKDEQIIIVQGHAPIRCGRAIYFRRADMDKAAAANRFVKTF